MWSLSAMETKQSRIGQRCFLCGRINNTQHRAATPLLYLFIFIPPFSFKGLPKAADNTQVIQMLKYHEIKPIYTVKTVIS